MDTLINKNYVHYDYLSRYEQVPTYYDTIEQRYVSGIGKNIDKNRSYFTYKVKPDDTLDKIALKYYNNPTYWWILAYFNDIQDALVDLAANFSVIKIPNIVNIDFIDLRS